MSRSSKRPVEQAITRTVELVDWYDRLTAAEVNVERLPPHDAWDLWKTLFLAQITAMAEGRAPTDEVTVALFDAARVSLFIEVASGNWERAGSASLGVSLGLQCLLGQLPDLRPDQLAGIGRLLHRFPELAAYAFHRAGHPSHGPIIIEALTSVHLGQQMTMQALQQLATTGADPTGEMLTTMLRRLEAARADLAAPQAVETTKSSAEAERPAERSPMDDVAQIMSELPNTAMQSPELGSFFAGNHVTYAQQAADITGRHVLYLAAAPEGGVAFRITPADAAGSQSIELPELSNAVLDVVDRIHNSPAGKKARATWLRAALESVGAAVWLPILRQWHELRREPFALVPVGETAQLPLFTALIEGVPAGALLDMTIVPSARALLLASARTDAKLDPVVVLADTANGMPDLPPIPLTADEVQRIAVTHGVVANIFRDAEERTRSTEEELLHQIGSAGLVHLACHGSIDHTEPFDSILHLGPGLRLRQIWEQRLPTAPLVVLSACEIGGISAARPSEQLGFPAVLLASGAVAVVGALWAVPETADTVRLMLEFHRLVRDGRPPNLALGSAIATLNTDGVSPSVWGPFTYIGAANKQ